jgi:hypothetical protein
MTVKALRKANPNMTRSDIDIMLDLKPYGFDPSGKLPMYLQHLGASEAGFAHAAQVFMELGARENTGQVRAQGLKSKLAHSYRHDEGVPIHTLEISKADRSRSAAGTGFIGFFDASWNTFQTIVKIDRQRTALRAALAADPKNVEAAKAEAEIRQIFSTASKLRAFHNWGGTSLIYDELDNTKYVCYPQQVPCGRFSLYTGNGSETKLLSVWGTRAQNLEAGETPVVAAVAAPETSEEEPF